jgi:hypothetical protein
MTPTGVLDPVRDSFRAFARAVVPATSRLDARGWASLEGTVEEALADRPAAVRRQLLLFVRVTGLLAILRYGRSLHRLSPVRAARLLGALERAPIPLLRRGVWGVRTLVFMGYYAQPDVQAELGYRAAAGGWAARGGAQGPWSDRSGAAGPEPSVVRMLESSDDGA